LGYFQGKPAGVCGLVSFNNVGGIFSVGTVPEYGRQGIATAFLQKGNDRFVDNGKQLAIS